ncbi:disintegrin and metalloproteinase domain-containing protein 10-like [Notothenia coriiceps]|uniref:Disintegrin and metalloproteinase domain-containing protein 10-like n=1 Tax=Notothenia coriiceps TaxID=8208 RepID=A0A6I9PWJ2_9TELE|nr:PREDICTED: disintegrin and metalloproteinase domain-containing protein 10-like [Notothenia coriiceps]
MGFQHYWLLLLLLVNCHPRITGAMSSISPYIKHYEGLSYDREDLHRKHLRAKRASHPEEHALQLDITAFNRTFRLLLKHNAEAFTENVMVIRKNGSTPADLSHLYSGKLEGEQWFRPAWLGVTGVSLREPSKHTENGTYHIEPYGKIHQHPTQTTLYHLPEDDRFSD